MAKFESSIGIVRGNYGNLITNENRIRSKPIEYHDTNTPEQQK